MLATQALSGILFLGLAFKAIGYVIRDELLLRALVVLGMLCDIAFYALQPVPILQSVATNALLTGINLVLIVLIVFERTTLRMSARDRELYSSFPTLRPGQFRRVLKHASWHVADRPTRLISEGQALDQLFFIQSPAFSIEKQGRRYQATGPAFAGELVFLNGGLSSASVWVPEGCTYVSFDNAKLHKAMERSVPLNNAMVALFGQDLARKVANSVPMPARDTPPLDKAV